MRQDAISADPDIEQAVEDFVPVVGEIRALSAAKANLKAGGQAAIDTQKRIDDRNQLIAVRADRLGISADALVLLCTHVINAKARRGRGEPSRPTVRTLMDEVTFASSRETTAARDLTRAQATMVEATRRRIAAEEAYGILCGTLVVSGEKAA